ncbi:MAG TPA: glycosyltransferase [Candidatus Limnocylindria bacterium]|nr:glycosyltransferase [Candidatus Limnocylindria bacterium]
MNRFARVAALVGVLVLTAVIGMAASGDALARDNKQSAEAFRADMRQLWEDHIVWTRQYIVSAATSDVALPDADETLARLLRNQDDIGNAIASYYGQAAGDALAALLKDHILIAGQLVSDVKSGSPNAAATQAAWFGNADDIATFLAQANPGNWPFEMMQDHMYGHLTLTAEEAVARIQGRYADDIAAYDQVHVQILGMADMLADGIVAQFPNRFSR